MLHSLANLVQIDSHANTRSGQRGRNYGETGWHILWRTPISIHMESKCMLAEWNSGTGFTVSNERSIGRLNGLNWTQIPSDREIGNHANANLCPVAHIYGLWPAPAKLQNSHITTAYENDRDTSACPPATFFQGLFSFSNNLHDCIRENMRCDSLNTQKSCIM